MTQASVRGIDLFKIAGRSTSGWIPSLKTGNPRHVRQPFCSQMEERLLMYLEYHPQVVWYARGDISAQFAATYRLPMPKEAAFAIGYVFEGKPLRRRLDRLQPFCRIAGHTSEEVREVLVALEGIYREQFPQLNLHQWTGAIHTWLTHPLLDPASSGRVVMDYLMKLVATALEWTAEHGEADVSAQTLEAAAELLTLRRDAIRLIDGEPGNAGQAPA